jgi:hypothetical protein
LPTGDLFIAYNPKIELFQSIKSTHSREQMVSTRSMTLKGTGQPFERKKYGGDPVFFNGRLNMNNQSSRFNRVHQFGKGKTMIEKLVDECQKNDGITKRAFLSKIGKIPSSHHDQFSAFNKSGIVELDRKTWKYHLGPNYEAWLEGRLFIKE